MPKKLPGQRTGRTTTPRDVMLSHKGKRTIPGGGTIDATYAYDGSNTSYERELRAGCLMGRITATGLWVPLKRTAVAETGSGSGSAGQTEVLVDDASFFLASDPISVDGTDCNIVSVDYTANLIVVDAVLTNLADGDAVIGANALAGAETARAILNEFVDMIDHDDNVARDRQVSELVIEGLVNNNNVLGDLAAARADTGAFLNGILWGDQQGAVD